MAESKFTPEQWVLINGERFFEEPTSCGSCPFFFNGSTHMNSGSEKGHCRIFNEMHRTWRSTPRRCAKLFRKALKQPARSELVIVLNPNIK